MGMLKKEFDILYAIHRTSKLDLEYLKQNTGYPEKEIQETIRNLEKKKWLNYFDFKNS